MRETPRKREDTSKGDAVQVSDPHPAYLIFKNRAESAFPSNFGDLFDLKGVWMQEQTETVSRRDEHGLSRETSSFPLAPQYY
jgi:hypothetical protein